VLSGDLPAVLSMSAQALSLTGVQSRKMHPDAAATACG
jgi:hypothetical protein